MTTDLPRGHIDPIPHAARPYQGQPAGIVTRLAAAVLDSLVVCFVMAGTYLGWCGLLFLIEGRSFSFPRPGVFFGLGAAFVIAFFYLTVFWALTGRTYGYLVMGLRVQRRSGKPLRLLGAAVRAAFVLVFPVGILWVPVSRDNKSLQDGVLTTRVVYDWKPRAARIAAQAGGSDACKDADAG
jgi:uncharacterized RDD family membrane protein YckC